MDNGASHHEKLCKAIDKRLGKGKAKEILDGTEAPPENASGESIGQWAETIIRADSVKIAHTLADLLPASCASSA